MSVAGGTSGFPQAGIWIVGPADLKTTFLVPATGYPVWLADQDTVAVPTVHLATADRPRRLSILLVDVRSQVTTEVYENESGIGFLGASASPDAGRIVTSIHLGDSDSRDLFLIDLKSGVGTRITEDGGNAFPSWSPTSDLIAYQHLEARGAALVSSIRLVGPDGTCSQELKGITDALTVSWSPDGTRLAYIAADGIYVVDLQLNLESIAWKNGCLLQK
jgi:Tol biopolymer transport system component